MNSVSRATIPSRRLMKLAGVVMSGLALIALGIIGLATSARGATGQATAVSLALTPGAQGTQQQTFQVIAALTPKSAYGNVTLTDNGTVIGRGNDYRIEWSWDHQGMSVGVHHLVLTFDTTGDADDAYAPSQATATYTVVAPDAATGTNGAGATAATPTTKASDTQPIGVTIPSHGSTGPTKTKSPGHKKKHHHKMPAGAGATGVANPPGGSGPGSTQASGTGSNLPSTGFDALLAVAVGMVLLAIGSSMTGAARRKRDQTA